MINYIINSFCKSCTKGYYKYYKNSIIDKNIILSNNELYDIIISALKGNPFYVINKNYTNIFNFNLVETTDIHYLLLTKNQNIINCLNHLHLHIKKNTLIIQSKIHINNFKLVVINIYDKTIYYSLIIILRLYYLKKKLYNIQFSYNNFFCTKNVDKYFFDLDIFDYFSNEYYYNKIFIFIYQNSNIFTEPFKLHIKKFYKFLKINYSKRLYFYNFSLLHIKKYKHELLEYANANFINIIENQINILKNILNKS